MFKFDDTNLFGKDAMDTILKSYSAAAKGLQAIAAETAEYSKKAYEANMAHVEALMSVRSLETAVELNTSFAKTMMEGYLAELNKLGEMYSDIAKQTYAPAQSVASKAVESVKTKAASVVAA
jgi:hypothetical protein